RGADDRVRLAPDRVRGHVRRAVLVRPARPVHGGPHRDETARAAEPRRDSADREHTALDRVATFARPRVFPRAASGAIMRRPRAANEPPPLALAPPVRHGRRHGVRAPGATPGRGRAWRLPADAAEGL